MPGTRSPVLHRGTPQLCVVKTSATFIKHRAMLSFCGTAVKLSRLREQTAAQGTKTESNGTRRARGSAGSLVLPASQGPPVSYSPNRDHQECEGTSSLPATPLRASHIDGEDRRAAYERLPWPSVKVALRWAADSACPSGVHHECGPRDDSSRSRVAGGANAVHSGE